MRGVVSKVNSPTIKTDSSLAPWPRPLATPLASSVCSLPEQEQVGELGRRGQSGGGVEGGETGRRKVWRWLKEERGE